MSNRPLLFVIAVGIVLTPVVALAQTGAVASPLPYLAIAAIAWFAIDKIVDLLPVRENTLVQFARKVLNSFFSQVDQKK